MISFTILKIFSLDDVMGFFFVVVFVFLAGAWSILTIMVITSGLINMVSHQISF